MAVARKLKPHACLSIGVGFLSFYRAVCSECKWQIRGNARNALSDYLR